MRNPSALWVVALALVAPGTAGAQAGGAWEAERVPATPAAYGEETSLLFDRSGRGLAAWWGPGSSDDDVGPVRAFAREPGSGWQADRLINGEAWALPRLTLLDRGRVAMVVLRWVPRVGVRYRLLRARRLGSRPRSLDLDPGHTPNGVRVVSNRRGRAIVVWDRYRQKQPVQRGFARVYRPGRGFGARRAVTPREKVCAPDATMNERGDVLIAWQVCDERFRRRGELKARLLTADGRLGPIRTLGRTVEFGGVELTMALGNDRRGVLAWGGNDDEYPTAMYRVVLRRGGAFGPTRRLARRAAIGRAWGYDIGNLQALATPAGEIALAWTDGSGAHARVRFATVGSDALRGIHTVSPPGSPAHLLDLRSDWRGRLGLLLTSDWSAPAEPPESPEEEWELGRVAPSRLLAGLRDPRGRFGALEQLTSSSERLPVAAASLDFDPHDDRPVAVWIEGRRDAGKLRAARR